MRATVFARALILVATLALFAACADPEPKSTPAPSPTSTLAPTTLLSPTPEPTPRPMATPIPSPTPTPTPTPPKLWQAKGTGNVFVESRPPPGWTLQLVCNPTWRLRNFSPHDRWKDSVTVVTRTEVPGMVIWTEYRDTVKSSTTRMGCGVAHVCLETVRVAVQFDNPVHKVNKQPFRLRRPDEPTTTSYIFSKRLTNTIIDRLSQDDNQTVSFSTNDVLIASFDEGDFRDVVLPWRERCIAQAES